MSMRNSMESENMRKKLCKKIWELLYNSLVNWWYKLCFKNWTELVGSQSGPVKTNQKPGWTRNFEKNGSALGSIFKTMGISYVLKTEPNWPVWLVQPSTDSQFGPIKTNQKPGWIKNFEKNGSALGSVFKTMGISYVLKTEPNWPVWLVQPETDSQFGPIKTPKTSESWSKIWLNREFWKKTVQLSVWFLKQWV